VGRVSIGLTATPPPPKKRSGRPSVATNREVEKLGRYLNQFLFKTARLRSRGLRVYDIEGVPEEAEHAITLGRQKAAVNSKDGQEEAAVLPEVQVVDQQRLGKSNVFGRVDFQACEPKGPEGKADQHYKQKYVVVNVKHSDSVMVWGCFSGIGGRGSLYFLPPRPP
jgi:hypothetical protein